MSTQETGHGSNEMFGLEERPTSIFLTVLIALKIVLLFVLAWNTRFVMDEFVQLGWAKYLSNGLFETIWPSKAVGYAVFYKLAHLIGWDAQSILLVGRIQTTLLACATVAIIYGCARAIGESRLRALAIVLVLLCFSNFMERIFRTIAEPVALFFAATALLVVLRGRTNRASTLLVAGALSGLAFLATQKSIYFNVALGLALVADAALARRYLDGIVRGAWLVFGWIVPIVIYCLIFGGGEPVAIARNLVFAPLGFVAENVSTEYGGLRHYVVQTLVRNTILYAFCFTGMALTLVRITKLEEHQRIALLFTITITLLVFAHDQPWPYVFLMALPFMSLWSLVLFDRVSSNTRHLRLAWIALGISVTTSYVMNILYLRFNNADQLVLVGRAESLIGPDERYFDGIGMLPNRMEPTILWLDRHYVLKTLRERKHSEAYEILANSPTKVILWSYRMDNIYPVIAPLIRNSYVRVAPNIRMAGRHLCLGKQTIFNVPIAGTYQLYGESGKALKGQVEFGDRVLTSPFYLDAGPGLVTLRSGPAQAFLLPKGSYSSFKAGSDNPQLFADVYR